MTREISFNSRFKCNRHDTVTCITTYIQWNNHSRWQIVLEIKYQLNSIITIFILSLFSIHLFLLHNTQVHLVCTFLSLNVTKWKQDVQVIEWTRLTERKRENKCFFFLWIEHCFICYKVTESLTVKHLEGEKKEKNKVTVTCGWRRRLNILER